MALDLLQTLNDGMASFSKGQKKIAKYLIENYDKAAYMTASRMGEATGVSESTVVRFATELGYDGYPELQKKLQELIRRHLTSVQRVEVTNSRLGDANVLEKILLSDIDKIKLTLETINHQSFELAVDRIINAKNIYIIGVRSSAALAQLMYFGLGIIFDNVRLVQTTSGSELFEHILPMTDKDVMIAVSFPRYSSRLVNAVEYAKQVGAGVVAITDNDSAPIAEYANELLVAQSDMASFMDSLTAPLSVLNALIVAISRKKHEDITKRLAKLESIWEKYEVYTKNRV